MRPKKVNKRALVRWKVYFDRARMYIGYINFFMIIVMFINSIKHNIVGEFIIDNAWFTVPILITMFVVSSLILGYLDTKLGFRKEELRNSSSENPVLMEILNTVRELKESNNK